MPEVQEQRAWHDLVTLDESWFYCNPDYESIWLPPGEKVPEAACHDSMQKVDGVIVWNFSGFYLTSVLASGCKFKSSCCRREVLEHLSERRCEQAGGAGRKFIVHADNARPHTQRQHHKNSWKRTD
jgi:hypothetical protein